MDLAEDAASAEGVDRRLSRRATKKRCCTIHHRLRPGNPPQLEKARALFSEKFFDANRYRLGRVGRFRMNRKLDLNVPEKRWPAAGRFGRGDQLPASALPTGERRSPTSTTSITSAIVVCGRSTNWRAMKSARAS